VRRARCAVRRNARNPFDRTTHSIRWIGDAEGRPRMPAGTEIGDAIAARAQRAMHDALDAGPVQGDECVRTD